MGDVDLADLSGTWQPSAVAGVCVAWIDRDWQHSFDLAHAGVIIILLPLMTRLRIHP